MIIQPEPAGDAEAEIKIAAPQPLPRTQPSAGWLCAKCEPSWTSHLRSSEADEKLATQIVASGWAGRTSHVTSAVAHTETSVIARGWQPWIRAATERADGPDDPQAANARAVAASATPTLILTGK